MSSPPWSAPTTTLRPGPGREGSSVRLVKAGTIVGSNLGTAVDYTATDVAEAHGSESNLWGTTWTAAEINASNFGVVYAAFEEWDNGGNIIVSVDQITLTIYYTTGATFNVAKDFSDNSGTAVTISLACTSGMVVATDNTATEVPADTANFAVAGFTGRRDLHGDGADRPGRLHGQPGGLCRCGHHPGGDLLLHDHEYL